MGRIQSSIGLITGTDIVGTVDQLMQISARPRDRLLGRNKEIEGKQQQIASLTASVIGVQIAGNALGTSAIFSSKSVESSNADAVSVTAGDSAVSGKYTVRTLQTAATHAVESAQRFDSTDEALGLTGSLVIKPNGFVDQQVALADLNGGRGVQAGTIRLTDRSGRTADVDLSTARTIDDVLKSINDADVGIRATTRDGRIRLEDQTGSTTSNLKVTQLGSAETAADLGLWGIDAAAETAEGNAIELPDGVTSLRGASLSQLGGGSGLGPLTDLDIELSDGAAASIDLSQASSLSEVVDAINGAGLDLIARVNDAGNGLRLRDVSGGSGSFVIGSADTTSDQLGVTANTTDDIVVGTDLNLQTVSRETLLADLNQGDGPTGGSFTITDSSGASSAVNLVVDEITTVGELIDQINGLDIGVTAAVNDSGDGVVVTDTAGGGSSLTIRDAGTGTAAASLGIAGTADATSLTGSEAATIQIDAEDTLDSIVEKINDSGRYAGATATANQDGTYSLLIRSKTGGRAGRIAFNPDGLDLNFRTNSRGQDAVITLAGEGTSERFLTSADGVFQDELTGLNLTAKSVSSDPVTVTVDDDPDAVVGAVKRFSDQYNKLVDKINEVTFFDAEANEVGLLFGSTETLRIQSGFTRLLSGSFSGAGFGSVRSLGQIGVRLGENGKLSVDEGKLKDALADDPASVERLFINKDSDSDENRGFVGQLDRLADRIAGAENSMLIGKTKTLATQLERNNDRVDSYNERLASERERLLKQYYAMEEAIAKIQSNQQYVSQIGFLAG